jgi:hypothetical protein
VIAEMVEEQDERARRMIPEAPALAKETALARPTPLDAPVMRMVWPE